MKNKFKFYDSNGQVQEYFIKNNYLEDKYFKYNFDFYNKFYKSMFNFYRDYAAIFEKLTDLSKLYNHNSTNKDGTFPANGHDIYNYIARYGMANFQLQAIIRLESKLDFEKLKLAVRLSIEAEPVFRCKFVEDNPPHWKPLENIDIINFCSLEETNDVNESIRKFLDSPLDMDNDPNVKVNLIRSEEYDVIGIKINHACCDGTGTKEYIQLLSDIYSNIDQENDAIIPEPRIGGRKDQDTLFKALGITNPDSIFIPGSDISIPMWKFPWEQSSSYTARISVCSLPEGYLDVINNYAKSMGATVNDLILTAYYRAMLHMGQPIYGIPLEIPLTVDLRRYLPDHKTEAIRNFSGSVSTKLTMLVDEPFSGTLSRVISMMKEIKKGYPGLQSAIGLERLEKIDFMQALAYYQVSLEAKNSTLFCPLYCGDKCVPTLSNLGYVSRSLINFGTNTVTDAYIVPPVVRAPGLLLMVSTYNSIITLSAGYYKDTILKENVEKLLNIIRDELIQGCQSEYTNNEQE